MNKREANKKAQEMIDSRATIRCPMQGEVGVCIGIGFICECYKMPEVRIMPSFTESELIKDEGYFIHGGFCTCYALKGELP